MWPPPGCAVQHPDVSRLPASSHVTKITEPGVQLVEAMIEPTVDARKASPAAISCASSKPAQGTVPSPLMPCISWHWFGLIQTRSATEPAARSDPSCDRSTIRASRAGSEDTSRYDTKGSCLRA